MLMIVGLVATLALIGLWRTASSHATCFRVTQSEPCHLTPSRITEAEVSDHQEIAGQVLRFLTSVNKGWPLETKPCSEVQQSPYAKAGWQEGQEKTVGYVKEQIEKVDGASEFAHWTAGLPARSGLYDPPFKEEIRDGAAKIKIGLGAEHDALEAAAKQAQAFGASDCSGSYLGKIETASKLGADELVDGLYDVK